MPLSITRGCSPSGSIEQWEYLQRGVRGQREAEGMLVSGQREEEGMLVSGKWSLRGTHVRNGEWAREASHCGEALPPLPPPHQGRIISGQRSQVGASEPAI